MSGGRAELGLGAGWFDAEHTAYGVPFPPLGERFERLEEQFAILTGLWDTPVGETFDFDGRHYQLKDSPALPKPVQQPHPPLIVGGGGAKRTPRLAATFADEFNLPFSSLADTEAQFAPGARRLRRKRDVTPGPCGCRPPRPCAAAPTMPRWSAAPPTSAARPTSCAPTAWPAHRTRWWRGCRSSPASARSTIYLQVLDLQRPRAHRPAVRGSAPPGLLTRVGRDLAGRRGRRPDRRGGLLGTLATGPDGRS